MASATSKAVAIVTGTNSGLGLSMAVKLAASHRVFAGIRGLTDSKRAALDAAAAAANVAANISVIEVDVNSDSSVASALAAVISETGRVDVLVNNAGYSVFGTVEMLSVKTCEQQLNTNVLGVVRCTKAVLPSMRAQKAGKIINISSVGGVWGQPFNDIYCASKFALEGMVEAQAPVFRTFGVSVSCVQPGGIKTAFINNAVKPDPATIAAEYMRPIGLTMAAYQAGASSQTPDEVADIIMARIVHSDAPPVKLQTNAAIQPVFQMQLTDPSGEAGVKFATERFLTPAEPKATAPEPEGKM